MEDNYLTESQKTLDTFLMKAREYGVDAVTDVLNIWRNSELDPDYPKGNPEEELAYQSNKLRVYLDEKKKATNNSYILLVDDDEGVRDITNHFLQAFGYTNVMTASDGEEALSIFLGMEQKPDLVLSDMYMPKLDGLNLAKKLREHGYKGKVILTTGKYQDFIDDTPEDVRKQLFDYVLAKPYNTQEFKKSIDDCLQ